MRRGRDEGAGKKSEVVTVRLDPKLKYLAELAARKHRRPLSSYIEWAVEQSLSRVWLEEPFNGEGTSVADAERTQHLWDLDEPDRVVRLALNYPDLLTHEEQLVWKLVRENGVVWKGRYYRCTGRMDLGNKGRVHDLGPASRTLAGFQGRRQWKPIHDGPPQVAKGSSLSGEAGGWGTCVRSRR